jgi:hypothetical protein
MEENLGENQWEKHGESGKKTVIFDDGMLIHKSFFGTIILK